MMQNVMNGRIWARSRHDVTEQTQQLLDSPQIPLSPPIEPVGPPGYPPFPTRRLLLILRRKGI
jgi:hypothetical protein